MYQLFNYQNKLVNEVRNKLLRNRSVLIQSPAGSGKSVVIAEIARRTTVKGNRVMFMVHRKELVEQIMESFRKQDVDLDKCTIMTVVKIKHRLAELPRPQLLITDETHHGLAKTYQAIYDYYKGVPRLGFTATPWRMNGAGLNEVYQTMVKGPSVKWLIDHHFLAPFHYWTVDSIDHDNLQSSNKNTDYTNQSIDNSFGKEIFGNVVDQYRKYANGQKTIVYAHSILYSKMIAKRFRQSGINAVHVDSKTPTEQRETIMQDFKQGKIKVLCNVDLISEGFDVPDCSCVIMVRPTKSLVLFIQQSMRCMRSDHKGPNGTNKNKVATIIDMVGNAHIKGVLPDSNYDWEASFEGHPPAGKSPTQCQECMGTFFATKEDKRKVIKSQDNKIIQSWPGTTDNQIIFKWLTTHSGKAFRQTVCPYCEQVADEDEITRERNKNNEKEVVNDKNFVDLSDSKNRERFRLQKVANKSTRNLRRPQTIYDVFEARKAIQDNHKNPLFQTLYVLMQNTEDHDLTSKQLDDLAKAANVSFKQVRSAYIWAQQKWTFNDAPQYNFNF